MRPYYSYEDQQVKFSSWSRMAQPITSFQIIEICKSNVGENAPSKVRADVTIDLEYLKQDIRQEWNSLRKHDIGFLISLKPSNTPEQRYNSKESFLNQMGNVTVRGCEIEGFLNEDGKLIIDEGPNGIKNKLKFENNLRTFRVFLDSNQYKSDTDRQNDIINNNDDSKSLFLVVGGRWVTVNWYLSSTNTIIVAYNRFILLFL
jgi:intron-binding protein aquarius